MEVTFESSPQRKLQAWLEYCLTSGGITDPILQEDSGADVVSGRYILVSVDAPETHPSFTAGLQWAPLKSVIVIAVIQPVSNKELNTPAAINEFDLLGRKLNDIFLDPVVKQSGPHIKVSWIAHQLSGHDATTIDDNGRKLRVYAIKYEVTFSEKPVAEII